LKQNNCDLWDHLKLAPPDPILGTTIAYKNDKASTKMNLGVGAYRDDNEKPYPFQIVRKVDLEIAQANLDKEYLPIDGLAEFRDCAQKLTFGAEHPAVKEKRIYSTQSISGTGALRIAFDFIAKFMPATVYVSNPTWGNHNTIIESAGLKWKNYTYFDPKTKGLDLKGMLNDLSQAPAGSIVLLHACAHNPTGVDPTVEGWKQIATLMKEKNLFPLFDSAY